jgi:hypothetical protein
LNTAALEAQYAWLGSVSGSPLVTLAAAALRRIEQVLMIMKRSRLIGLKNPLRRVALIAMGCLTAAAANAATIAVPAGGNLQTALNAARAGDVITLVPGATYVGSFVLPNKGPITEFITLRSAAPDAALPPAGVRMTPAYAAQLPKLRSATSTSALRTAAGAHHWRLQFLEFQANLNGYGDIIALGAGDATQTQLAQVPFALVLDRVYVHGDPVLGQKRGVALHSGETTIVNSYVADCKAIGQDSQAVSGFNGPGPYLIENNYLEGATENFLLGGADPTIPNLVTTQVTFRRNHLRKPLTWRDPILAMPAAPAAQAVVGGGTLAPGTYAYRIAARTSAGQTNKAVSAATAEVAATVAAGTTGGITIAWTPVVGAEDYLVYGRAPGAPTVYWKTTTPYFTDNGAAGTAGTPAGSGTKWAVKNIFELKNAQDVLVEGNVFENLWVADQSGYPIVFTPRNQGGRAPWVVVQRVTFQYNLVRHAAGGVNILGIDNVAPSARTNTITVRHNVFDDLTSATWGAGSRPFILGDGPDSVTIDHNTVASTATALIWLYGGSVTAPAAATNAVITNNMAAHNTYGIMGSSFAFGTATIAAYLPGSVVARNVLAGGSASKYPTGNFLPTVASWKSGFVGFTAGDYHLTAASPYRSGGTDGADLGADVGTVNAQTAIALSGDNTISPDAQPVRIASTTLPNGILQQAYAETLTCTGGSGQCAWQVHDNALPAGVAFDAVAGLVSGTPSQVQTGQLVVEAFDPAWPTNRATATLALTVDAPPFVVTVPPAPATQVGLSYEVTPSATGAMGSPTWSLASGSLPPGVTIDPSSGLIRGIVESWGTFTGLVQAQDSWGTNRTDAKVVTVKVAPTALSIAADSLPNATYRTFYSALLSARGGTGMATWSLSGGALPDGVMLDASGALSGTPTATGTFTATVQVRDINDQDNVATRSLVLNVDAPLFSITLPPAPAVTVGEPFRLDAVAIGNVGAVAWRVVSGALPAGLTLDAASGAIAGSPSASGTFTVLVQATDSWGEGRVDVKDLTIAVAPTALVIATPSLPGGLYRAPYQASLVATGGSGSTTWSMASGALPPGVMLSATGSIDGTPAEAGTFTFAAHAVDANWTSNVDTKTFALVVEAPAFAVTVAPALAGRVGLPLQATATATGQLGTVIWSIASGALPAGVTLDATTGSIAGVPTTFGSFTAVMIGQDTWRASRVASAPLSIVVAPLPLAVSTATLSPATVKQAYQTALVATGGTGQTTWTVASGVLPAGLSLDANGAISGAPTTAGVFNFAVQASDAGWPNSAVTQALQLTVGAREVVMYAADATQIAGTWSRVADATAAGAARLSNPDAAAAKVNAALANPLNFFEVTFQAEAGVAYHLWVRGKADKNNWANDSVFVQFSGTVDANGAPLYRIGTTSAATVSIEDGTNAGLAGWGWADDSYGAFAKPLSFATTGPQTIRVQVREDGLSLDQIVLSAGTYATAAPGAAKNDTTLLPR